MKNLQQLCAAAALTLMMATATLAGHIGTGGVVQPPPPPASASATTSGEIPISPKDDAGYEYQLIEDITLELLRAMLSVF